jgi:O-acetyl-ADP-ribose deacetylase (regulator of RNase III)
MLRFTTGNLLDSNAEALVNTVNTVGVMGKGIALQFKKAFPVNNKRYREACKNGELVTGKLLVVEDSNKTIINFPTKEDWRNPSKNEYIASGLIALLSYLKQSKLKSIALPALGCGNGGLEWKVIKPMLTGMLSELTIEIIVYEPA